MLYLFHLCTDYMLILKVTWLLRTRHPLEKTRWQEICNIVFKICCHVSGFIHAQAILCHPFKWSRHYYILVTQNNVNFDWKLYGPFGINILSVQKLVSITLYKLLTMLSQLIFFQFRNQFKTQICFKASNILARFFSCGVFSVYKYVYIKAINLSLG